MHPTIERLRDAINRHDAQGMAALIAPEYLSQQPAHPNRGFSGADQVAKNWSRLFEAAPDMVADVRSEGRDGETSLSEWAFNGHFTDGSDFALRGCMVLGLRSDGAIHWARMYVEPVEQGGAAIDEAVDELTKPYR